MRIIKPNATYLSTTDVTPYQHIERIGRTCYKSEDKMTDESAVRFVGNMKKNRHYAMLEHAHLYFRLGAKNSVDFLHLYAKDHDKMKFMFVTEINFEYMYLSASFRALIEYFESLTESDEFCIDALYQALNKQYPEMFPEDERFMGALSADYSDVTLFKNANEFKKDAHAFFIEPSIDILNDSSVEAKFKQDIIDNYERVLSKHLTHSILFTCDRGVSHELVRHRPASFAQESTRYCNYAKGQFGSEITVIEPYFFKEKPAYDIWKTACEETEKQYMALLEGGATPQEARSVLPNSLKTDIIVTANELEWQHILDLRYHAKTGAPHPQMKELMGLCYDMLVEASERRIK